MITALRATSQTLVSVLSARLLAEPSLAALFGPGGATVSLATPDELVRRRAFGLSIWLYRVVRDEFGLNAQEERMSGDSFRRAPLPLRLHYLITPMLQAAAAQAPESEQHILGAVLQAFHDKPELSGADLSGDFAATNTELHVRLESLALDEITRIWDCLEQSYQLCVSYEVSLVEVASRRPDRADRPVLTPRSRTGLARLANVGSAP
jgi:hypothetical protein